MTIDDAAKTLGVDTGAARKEIKAAYYKLAHKHHPDKGGDETLFKQIGEAYRIMQAFTAAPGERYQTARQETPQEDRSDEGELEEIIVEPEEEVTRADGTRYTIIRGPASYQRMRKQEFNTAHEKKNKHGNK